ncbi:MAG: signal recognition particle receptor subunit alpha [Candidatus Woesearchaeota archaeon]
MLEKLSESLKKTITSIATSLSSEKEVIESAVKEIQRALISADVNVRLVLELSNKIKKRAFEEKPPSKISRKEQIINIIYEELVNILGKDEKLIVKKGDRILLLGLFGHGKTTTAAKLAYYYKKKGYKIALVQLDTFRPAAFEQLKQLSEKIHVDFFGDEKERDPVKVWKKYEKELIKYELIIVDTAGRNALEPDYIDEIKKINEIVNPNHKLLVITAETGQQSEKQARGFHESIGISGVIVTKMEGTAKGGGVLAACKIANVPVFFIGVGEKIEDLEEFDVKGFVGRLIGFGDIRGLLAKIQEEVSVDVAKELEKRIESGEFNLMDFYFQLETVKKFGSLGKLFSMIPGLSSLSLPKELINQQEETLEKWKYALQSFTFEELRNPEIINESRINRVSKGSGVKKEEIKLLIKQYKQMSKLLRMFKSNKGKMNDLLKKYKRLGIPFDQLNLEELEKELTKN